MEEPYNDRVKNVLQRIEKYFSKKATLRLQFKKPTADYNINLLVEVGDKKLFTKIYKMDQWKRMEREYSAIKFFYQNKLINVPQPYFKDENLYFAVYSYEERDKKTAKEVTKREILLISDCALRLHSFNPTKILKRIFPRSTGRACYQLENHILNYKNKMEDFLEYYRFLPKDDKFRNEIDRFDYIPRTEKILWKVVRGVSDVELVKPIDERKWRFNHGDFQIDNFIFKKRNNDYYANLVDFEYCGWDDPLRMIGDFLVHDRCLGISDDLKNLLLETYINKYKIHQKDIIRLNLIMLIMQIEWVAIYLRLLIPGTLEKRKLFNNNFREEEYKKSKLKRARERIINLESKLGM